MIKLQHLAVATAVALSMGLSAQAATVNINTNNSGAANTTGLSGFQTTGEDMVGMLVTATYDDGSSTTAAWARTGSAAGAASVASSWAVSLTGDSFNSAWTVTNSLVGRVLTSLFFQGQPGDTVFDMIASPDLTPGSARGKPYENATSGLSGRIDVTYSRPLALNNTFYGDLFVNMFVNYSGLTGGGLAANGQLRFFADTDNVSLPGDITPAIPLPAAGWLLLSGLAGLVAMRRRRKAA